MLVNVHKADVVKALELYRAEIMKISRRLFKRNALRHTRLFGFKIRSYEKAKLNYIGDELWCGFLEDSVYGYREYRWAEDTIRELDMIIKHDVNDVIALDLKYIKSLDSYFE